MNLSSKKILFVDDSPSMRLFAELALGKDFNIDTACDGENALWFIERNVYELFLIDIYMPRVDGISLIKKIREDEKNRFKPIIVISTEADEDILKRGREAGATGWIVKPFDEKHLLKTVKHLLFSKGGR